MGFRVSSSVFAIERFHDRRHQLSRRREQDRGMPDLPFVKRRFFDRLSFVQTMARIARQDATIFPAISAPCRRR
jgi:hypothetical protein